MARRETDTFEPTVPHIWSERADIWATRNAKYVLLCSVGYYLSGHLIRKINFCLFVKIERCHSSVMYKWQLAYFKGNPFFLSVFLYCNHGCFTSDRKYVRIPIDVNVSRTRCMITFQQHHVTVRRGTKRQSAYQLGTQRTQHRIRRIQAADSVNGEEEEAIEWLDIKTEYTPSYVWACVR